MQEDPNLYRLSYVLPPQTHQLSQTCGYTLTQIHVQHTTLVPVSRLTTLHTTHFTTDSLYPCLTSPPCIQQIHCTPCLTTLHTTHFTTDSLYPCLLTTIHTEDFTGPRASPLYIQQTLLVPLSHITTLHTADSLVPVPHPLHAANFTGPRASPPIYSRLHWSPSLTSLPYIQRTSLVPVSHHHPTYSKLYWSLFHITTLHTTISLVPVSPPPPYI